MTNSIDTGKAHSGRAHSASSTAPRQISEALTAHNPLRPSIIHVCTSCRAPGSPREPKDRRPGFQLYEALRERLRKSPLNQYVEVRSAECLSICPRPCGIALSSPGAWSYLFGDQDPGGSADAVFQCASLYIAAPDGFMPRKERPKSLQASILGRVPPLDGGR